MPRRVIPGLTALLVLLASVAASAAAIVVPGAAELAADVAALAAPEMEGRGSGTIGGERATRYIADRLAALGFRPGGDGGGYEQRFAVGSAPKAAAGAALERLSPAALRFEIGGEWQPHGGSPAGAVEGEVVAVGHGVSVPGGHDDYAGVDARGKIVLALDGAPAGLGGQRASRLEKLIAARKSGARALLIVSDTLAAVDATATRFPLPSATIRPAVAAALRAGARVRLSVDIERNERRAANLIGILPGTDPALAEEAIVIGAHYDHLGRVGGVVHPGADDNASGSAVVLGLARAFAGAGGLPRTLVVALFSGEELGLLGSRHYVGHPAVPLERTVAMVNFDMVGRMRDGKVSVGGVASGDRLRALVSDAAQQGIRLDLTLRDNPYGPSDHTSFYAAGVPVLFFHTGEHADYHKPTDTADRIDPDGMARVATLAAGIVERLGGEARPVYAKLTPPARRERVSGPAPGAAFLGVGGDASSDGDGARLTSIIPDTGASRAGLRDGDVLVRVDDTTVDSFEALRGLLGRKKPGDTVNLLYLRDGMDQVTSATLGGRQ